MPDPFSFHLFSTLINLPQHLYDYLFRLTTTQHLQFISSIGAWFQLPFSDSRPDADAEHEQRLLAYGLVAKEPDRHVSPYSGRGIA